MLEGGGSSGNVGINYYASGNIILGRGSNVGINDTSPSYRLSVSGDMGVSSNFWALNNAFVQGKLRFREN